MTRSRVNEIASGVVLVGALALLVDLFLGWHNVTVQVAGVVDIHATSSGWSGYGVAAGLFSIALIVWHTRSLRRPATLGAEVVTAGLAAATAGFTFAQAFVGEASVSTVATAVETGERLWPAYVGAILGAAVAVAALVRLVIALPIAGRGAAPHAA